MTSAISSASSQTVVAQSSPAAPSTEQELMSHFDDVLAGLLKISADAESAIAQAGDKLQALSNQAPPANTSATENVSKSVPEISDPGIPASNSVAETDAPSSDASSGSQLSLTDQSEAGDTPDAVSQFLGSLKASRAYVSGRQILAMADGLFAKNA